MGLDRTKQLASVVFANFAGLILLLVLPLGAYHAWQSYRTTSREIDSFRERYTASQRELIREHVRQTLHFIRFKRSTTEQRVRRMLRDRVYEAHALAQQTYDTWKGKLPLEDIQTMVREALRPIRFNDGRGYYFATRLDGVETLFADRPEMEGKNLLGMRDTQGQYVIRDMIELVREQGEGYYSYNWTKPEAPGKDFRKLSFIKRFEPFDWFIGTGEYLEDMEQDIRLEVLDWISRVRYENAGYVFIVRTDGQFVSHIDPAMLEGNKMDYRDVDGVPAVRRLIEQAQAGGGFVQYAFEKPGIDTQAPKVSYVELFEPWQWVIGTGVYLDDMNRIVEQRTQRLRERIGAEIHRLVLFTLGAIALGLVISLRLAHNLRREFDVFKQFFRKAEHRPARLNPDDLSYAETRSLAQAANHMVAERNRAEEERLKLTTIVEQAAESVLILGLDGRIEYANPAYLEMSGYDAQEILDKPYADMLAENGETAQAVAARALSPTGKTWSGRIVSKRKDGSTFQKEVIVSPLRNTGGEIVKIVAVGRDVTQEARLEEQLRQAQKMEAVGQLAGGVAHDFNNLLQVIQGHVDLALDDLEEESPARDDLEQIQIAGTRASTLVRQLLTFSRRETIEPKVLDLNELIAGMMKMLGRLIGEHIELAVEAAPDLPAVYADPGQIEQVLMNLCVNARDVMPEGGRIEIQTDTASLGEAAAQQYPWVASGAYVCLSVADNGPGIGPENIDHIFEPFFTTKEVGRGTGLGLATAYAIAKRHDGFMHVESRPGQGARFILYLPAHTPAPPTQEPRSGQADKPPGGSETILLAEDDLQVRELATEVLERAGYRVLVADDGAQAIEMFENELDAIHAALLDVVMPRQNGRAVFEAIRARRPRLPVLFASGYSYGQLDVERLIEEDVPVIQKPYRPADLLRAVRKVIDAT